MTMRKPVVPTVETYKPTESYAITLPEGICEEEDGSVTSYWIPGVEAALQLSSYKRTSGVQVDSKTRLNEHLAKKELRNLNYACLDLPFKDYALASFEDEHGIHWFYIYLTWPDLAIFITIFGPPDDLADASFWPFEAVRSIRRLYPTHSHDVDNGSIER